MSDNKLLPQSIVFASLFVAMLWWIKLLEWGFDWSLYRLGIQPGEFSGLLGILTAPLIHGSWEHLIANTLPLLLLGAVVLYGYPRSRWWVITTIWLVSGIGVWLFARPSYHFGASGITHGLLFFLLVIGLLRRDKRSIGLLMVAFFMYGTMLLTIFPRDPEISFEYHFFGAAGGVLAALLFRHWDPLPQRKVYSWDYESEEDEDPVIGDLWKKRMNEQETDDNRPER
ncbi:MAG: rhomboid family intramembrane serine protease [Pseudomonadales bacterium]